jgi:hypothetical protein
MNRVMDMERAVTPTCWARRAALGWKAACAAAPIRDLSPCNLRFTIDDFSTLILLYSVLT